MNESSPPINVKCQPAGNCPTSTSAYILSFSTSCPKGAQKKEDKVRNGTTMALRNDHAISILTATLRGSGGRRSAAHAEELFEHASKEGEADEESRPGREVVVPDVRRRAVVEGEESGAEGVQDGHDEAGDGGDEGGVPSEGGEERDEEGDDEANDACGCVLESRRDNVHKRCAG